MMIQQDNRYVLAYDDFENQQILDSAQESSFLDIIIS